MSGNQATYEAPTRIHFLHILYIFFIFKSLHRECHVENTCHGFQIKTIINKAHYNIKQQAIFKHSLIEYLKIISTHTSALHLSEPQETHITHLALLAPLSASTRLSVSTCLCLPPPASVCLLLSLPAPACLSTCLPQSESPPFLTAAANFKPLPCSACLCLLLFASVCSCLLLSADACCSSAAACCY